MIGSFFHAVFFLPLYNGLIFLLGYIPWGDLGAAVVLFTIIVKLVLFPLSKRSIQTQIAMRSIEGELAAVKERYKNDREGQARAVMALYKENGINPLSSFFLVLIQIPIILALYYVFYRGGLPAINANDLYSFVTPPSSVGMHFLGLIDLTKRSVVLAVAAGLSQYFLARFASPLPPSGGSGESFKENLARGMNLQMRYFMPIFIGFIAYSLSGAIALYWATSNLFSVGQELYLRRHFRHAHTSRGASAEAVPFRPHKP